MPHVKQYKSSVKRILHFMSQMTLESETIFTVHATVCYSVLSFIILKILCLSFPIALGAVETGNMNA
jgi:hypothetical protein